MLNDPCEECGGSGEVDCYLLHDCEEDECEYCEGSRLVECPECDGTGEDEAGNMEWGKGA